MAIALERSAVPRAGDTVVTLRLEVDEPLDQLVHDMAIEMARALRGNKLRRVLDFDPKLGVVTFAVRGEYSRPGGPTVEIETDEWREL